MRELWKKIYFVALAVSVVLMNTGLLLTYKLTYQNAVHTERERITAEYEIIQDNMRLDMNAMTESELGSTGRLAALVRLFENYYKDSDIRLYLWKDRELLYAGEERLYDFVFSESGLNVSFLDRDQVTVIQINGKLTVYTGENYYLSMEQPLVSLCSTWERLKKRYLLLSFTMLGALAAALAVVLRRLMRPVRELYAVVSDMAQGNYDSRADISGKDDIAALGRQFNDMADTIQNNLLQKQEFIDNFAHELKSPLTSIYGFAEYIEKTNADEDEKAECMQFIMEESRRLLDLSYTLLDMANLREQKSKIAMEWFSAGCLCELLDKQMKQYLEDKDVALHVAGMDTQVYGNQLLLQSLVDNLVKNAVNACAGGGEVTVQFQDAAGGVELTVVDNGCGMEQEALLHVTEPFFRVDKARSRENGGTGLGLSLCQKIVEVHQGEIQFASAAGEGTKVCVVLGTAAK